MRLTSVVALCIAVVFTTACDDDNIAGARRPPTAQVRFINAVNEGWAVDIRSITQVEWTPVGNNLPYRGMTVHYPTEAGKELVFRVFPTSINIDETSRVLHETSFTFQEGLRYSLVLTGSVAGPLQFLVINDDVSPPPSDNIGVRFVNMTTGTAQGYLTALPGDPLPGAPTFANVGARSASAYVAYPAAAACAPTPVTACLTAHATGTATAGTATQTGPRAGAQAPGQLPTAGVNSAGTRFSVYYFHAVSAIAATLGRPAVAAVGPTVVWMTDRNPAD
jgi:hypothetical protein